MVKFAGQLSESDFRKAQWLSTPRFFRWFGLMIFVAFGLVIATGGLKSIEADPVTSFAKLAAVLLFATYVTVAPRRAIAKAWRNTPLLHEAVEGA